MSKYNTAEYKAWLWRIPIIVLIVVEFASLQNYIAIDPSFTASGLLLQSIVFYIFLELINHFIKKYRKMPPWWVASSMVILLAMDAIGDYLHWYDRFPYYDAILHFLIPMTTVLGIWAIRHTFALVINYKILFFSVVPCVITLAVLYELEEYLEDVFTGSQRLGDGFDTANDLLMGLLGALLPVVLHFIYHKVIKRP